LRYRLSQVNVTFEYQSVNMPQPAILDIKEEYRKLGGKITEETEIEFDKYIPDMPYLRTALTNKMRNGYPCETAHLILRMAVRIHEILEDLILRMAAVSVTSIAKTDKRIKLI